MLLGEKKMAKYTASPWGKVRGKIGGAVGSTWKGIDYLRAHLYPKQVGSIRKLDAFEGGCARGINFSAAQMNIRRVSFGMLGYLGRHTHAALMTRIWQTLADKKGLKKTGLNLFIQKNARILHKSYNSGTTFDEFNLPDYTQMIISDGNLEPAFLFTGALKGFPFMGQPAPVTISWSTVTLRNGNQSDDVWVGIYIKPDARERAALEPYGMLYISQPGKKRSDGTCIVYVPNKNASDMTAFLFFSDGCANYSPSLSRQVS